MRMVTRGKTLVLLLLLIIAFPPAASGAADAAAPGEDPLTQLWSSRAGELTALAKEATTLRDNAEKMALPLSATLQDARTQFSRLSGLFQASRGHPTEQLTVARQMRALQSRLKNNIQPLEEIASVISMRLEEIAGLQKDMDEFAKEHAEPEDKAQKSDGQRRPDGQHLVEWKNYARTLTETKTKLAGASVRVNSLLAPAKMTAKRIEQALERMEGSLMEIWRAYYLTPAQNDLGAVAAMPALLADWGASLSSRMRFAYPQNATEWQSAAKSFTVSAVIMTILGFLFLRGTKILSKRWHQACADVVKGAWVWVAGGMAVLTAAVNQYGGIYFAFVLPGTLMVIAGVASLSWRLRTTVKPGLAGKPSPLVRLLPAAAAGVFMLFSDLPPRVLGILWDLVMLVFVLRICMTNRKDAGRNALPLLERFSYGCAFWFGLASLLTSVLGYARLAILLFMALFALINTVTLGNALMALFENLANRLFSKETRPIRNAVAEAVATPLAWLVSLICTVPWLWSVPGARYLLRHALETHYTLGEASFDFSRLLLVALLFFLFRSFINLSNTSLTQLPEHMPHIERGVIPPLRTMSGYILWSVFALVTLGILGVNFTSLAVVAGGLSVGIGFGMQNLFNNLVSGLMLIFGRNILVGDYVDMAGTSGTVRAINIRSTTIETPERALVYVPNSAVMAGQFANWTRSSRMVRRSILVGVAYGSNIENVTRILMEAAGNQANVLKDPAPTVLFTNFGAHSLDFTLNVFIDDVNNGASTLSAIRFAIEREFREKGIEIPFPQLTLHMPEPGALDAVAAARK